MLKAPLFPPLRLLLLLLCLTPTASSKAPALSAPELSEESRPQQLFVSNSLQELERAIRATRRLQTAAIRAGDEELLRCISGRLTSLRTLLPIMQSAAEAWEVALSRGDEGRADHELRRVAVALAKARQFAAEAASCQGIRRTEAGLIFIEATADALSEDPITIDPPEPDFEIGTDIDSSPFQ